MTFNEIYEIGLQGKLDSYESWNLLHERENEIVKTLFELKKKKSCEQQYKELETELDNCYRLHSKIEEIEVENFTLGLEQHHNEMVEEHGVGSKSDYFISQPVDFYFKKVISDAFFYIKGIADEQNEKRIERSKAWLNDSIDLTIEMLNKFKELLND